jgi:hypothetical protein
VNTEIEDAPGARDGLAEVEEEDLSDLSDGLDLVEDTALQTFVSTLQEAQRLAIQLEREKESQKRNTPKTYLGNSKRTLYRCEKARKALASQGFLDIGSFLALKKEERDRRGRERGGEGKLEDDVHTRGAPSGRSESSPTHAMADLMSTGGSLVNESEGDDDHLPRPTHRVQHQSGDTDEACDTAGAHEPSQIAHTQSRRVDTIKGCGADKLVDPLEVGRDGLSDRSRGGDEMGDAIHTSGHGRIGRVRCGLAEESEESSSEDMLSGPASHTQSKHTEACDATGALGLDHVAQRM